uniref:JmjC domain-containing protein n=1 Tax=Mesocestoides corti TaxID=53468 RepID=A0A5K3EV56_MESCO
MYFVRSPAQNILFPCFQKLFHALFTNLWQSCCSVLSHFEQFLGIQLSRNFLLLVAF